MEAIRESKNLGDLLQIQQEDHRHLNVASAGGARRRMTLPAVLSGTTQASRRQTQSAVQSSRTLLDILRDEEQRSTALGSYGRAIRWSLLKNMMRLHRNDNSNHVEAAAVSISDTTRGEVGPSRTSLMALLQENGRQQMGLDGYERKLKEEEEEEEEEEVNSSTTHQCCVCMVRHKGAAFIPCGHTFCRLCSRELWVQRGNCPLCNNKIVEILDIF